MPCPLPSCPHLPPDPGGLDWRCLNQFGSDRGPGFYLRALEYGHSLWQRRLPARAILCLDRAFGADLSGHEPVLQTWPLPYRAMAWFLREAPPDAFIGNPRVHFQHLADRLGPPRREQRAWRAWACWALARAIRPDWENDPRHAVSEPNLEAIATGLVQSGLPGESKLWTEALHEEQQLAARR
jgi:hypothetical protein